MTFGRVQTWDSSLGLITCGSSTTHAPNTYYYFFGPHKSKHFKTSHQHLFLFVKLLRLASDSESGNVHSYCLNWNVCSEELNDEREKEFPTFGEN